MRRLAALLVVLWAGYALAQTGTQLNLPIQNARSTAANGGGSVTASKTKNGCAKNPANCKPPLPDPGKHQCTSCPPPPGGTPGGGDPGDPLIYSEEAIPVAYLNLAWNGPTPYTAWNADPRNPDNCNHTNFASSAASASGIVPYPYASFIPDASLYQLTFYPGDGDTNAIGTQGLASFQFIAIQGDANGSTSGLVMAPSTFGFNWDLAILVNKNMCLTNGLSGVTPWAGGYIGMQMNANITIPFVYAPVTDGLIGHVGESGHDGISFGYFVMWLQNVNDASQNILILARFFQSHFLNGSDASDNGWVSQLGNGVGIWNLGDGTPTVNARIGIDTNVMTNCGTAGFQILTTGANTGPQSYCWQMSAAQLTAAINLVNASGNVPRHNYDTTASNWQVLLINQNYETWTHAGGDQRIGLNTSGFQFWIQ